MNTISKNTCDNCDKLTETREHYHYFISHLSHEVRNPLTLISSSLQLIEKECPSVTDSALWPQVREDVRNTICLLQDISSLNNADTLNCSTFCTDELLSSIHASFSSFMKERGIHFTVEADPSAVSLSLTADRRKLQEVLTNLLINAADALCGPDTSKSSEHYSRIVNPCITLTVSCENKMLCIHVKDNGPGIPDEYLETLFDPFVTHKTNGTGLGLSIAWRVARLHGGYITVDTDTAFPDSYADFCLCLPTVDYKM